MSAKTGIEREEEDGTYRERQHPFEVLLERLRDPVPFQTHPPFHGDAVSAK